MVSEKFLVKAIGLYLEKCGVTLKGVRGQIETIVRSIANNESDYELLMEMIPRFYRDFWNAPKENMYAKGKDVYSYATGEVLREGDVWELVEGEETRIVIPQEIIDYGDNYGMKLGMHNHPYYCCFPSYNDFVSMSDLNEDYSVIVAKDGVFIAKKTGYLSTPLIGEATFNLQKKTTGNVRRTDEYKRIKEQYDEGKISKEECDRQCAICVNDWYSENFDDCLNDLNKVFKDDDLGIECYHIPISR